MTVDQSTGYLWFVFYDRRAHADSATDVYMACSKDGGETYVNFRVSQAPFISQPGFFLGDYLNISAAQGVVRPIWIRMDSVPGWWERSVWTSLVDTGRINENAASIRRMGSPPVKRRPWILSAPNFFPGRDFLDVLGRRHFLPRFQGGGEEEEGYRIRKPGDGHFPPSSVEREKGASPKAAGWLLALVLLLILAGYVFRRRA